MIEFIVTKDYENMRIDRIAREFMKEYTLSYIFSSFRKGKIKLNGKKIDQSYRVQIGDVIKFFDLNVVIEEKKVIKVVSQEISFSVAKQVVYENEDFLLFDKRGNQVIHAGSDHEVGIIEILRQYYHNSELTAINRLDKPTWGLVLIGKHKNAIRKLSEYMRDDKIIKRYLAVCKGSILNMNFVIDKPLLIEVEKVSISPRGKEACTGVHVLTSQGDLHLLELELFTGRKHQIRVHLASVGLPIMGDYKYGIKYGNKMFLSAYYIEIEPISFKFKLENQVELFKKVINGESK